MNQLMNLNGDINSFMQMVQQGQSNGTVITSLLFSMGLSAILYFTYKHSYTSLNYNKRFNITLMMIAFISTILMDLIQSNLALSLGMLGSLSIVRFRTNIKDSRDIGFIFWSMAIGISSSVGGYFIGIVGSVIMSIFMITTSKNLRGGDLLLLVIRGENTDINLIEKIINEAKGSNKIKAKNILADSFELVYEIKVAQDEDNKIINKLLSLEGIDSVNILAPNTEVV